MKDNIQRICFSLLSIIFLFSCAYSQEQEKAIEKDNQPLKILSKPRASYTDEARANNVQGTVKLEITFLAEKKIGEINFVNEDNEQTRKLKKYGLVSAAIRAAKQIKFNPQLKDGKPVTVKNIQTYTFTIY